MRQSILHARIRANPRYQLVAWDHLEGPPTVIAHGASDSYGILRACVEPADAARSPPPVAVVSRDLALLLFSIREPAVVPELLRSLLGARAERELERLIRERIVEICQTGEYVSGTVALEALGRSSVARLGGGVLSELAKRALEHASLFVDEGVMRVAERLYRYHRIPVSPRWRDLVPDARAAARFLGLDAHGTNAAMVAAGWRVVDGEPMSDGWFAWRREELVISPHSRRAAFKLYVSPLPDHLPDTLARSARALAAKGCVDLKVARDAGGFLRPDKLVAYFSSRAEVVTAAERLRAELAGIPAQGVPFTAELSGDGLLSWATDPPSYGREDERASWRSWLCQTLAGALIGAVEDRSADPCAAALERLGFEGVDVRSWSPTAALWK